MSTTQALAALGTIALCMYFVLRAYIEATADSAMKQADIKIQYMPVSIATEMRLTGRVGHDHSITQH